MNRPSNAETAHAYHYFGAVIPNAIVRMAKMRKIVQKVDSAVVNNLNVGKRKILPYLEALSKGKIMFENIYVANVAYLGSGPVTETTIVVRSTHRTKMNHCAI